MRRIVETIDMFVHEYSVQFRILVPGNTVEFISEKTGLQPSHVRYIDKTDESIWGYNGSDEFDYSIRWENFEDGLEFVLDKLEPLRETLDEFISAEKNTCVWWCGHFYSSFDGGPTLSPKLLRRLGDFGVELYIDNYWSSKPEEV